MATVTWSAGAAGNWSNPANWSTNTVPAFGDDVVFNATSVQNCTVDINTAPLNSFTVTAAYTGSITYTGFTINCAGNFSVSGGNTTLISGGTGTLYISSSGTFLLNNGSSSNPGGTLLFDHGSTTVSGTSVFKIDTVIMSGGQLNLGTNMLQMFLPSTASLKGDVFMTSQSDLGFIRIIPLGSQTMDLSAWIFSNVQLWNDGTGLRTLTLSGNIQATGFVGVDGGAGVGQMTVVASSFGITADRILIQNFGSGTGTLDLSGGGTLTARLVNVGGGSIVGATLTLGPNAISVGTGGLIAGALGTINGSTGTINITGGNFLLTGTSGTFNANGTTVKIAYGNYDSSAGIASWNAGSKGTLQFTEGNCTLKSAGIYSITQSNLNKLIIDAAAKVTMLVFTAMNGPSPSLTVNGVLDLGGFESLAMYDYVSSPSVTGPLGDGVIQNGAYLVKWGAQNMTFVVPSGLTMNCGMHVDGINPFPVGTISFILGSDLNLTGYLNVNSGGFGASGWQGIATFGTNGFKLTVNGNTAITGSGTESSSLYLKMALSNSTVLFNGTLTLGGSSDAFTVLDLGTSKTTITGSVTSWAVSNPWPQGSGTLTFALAAAQSLIAGAAGASIVLPNVVIGGPSALSFTASLTTLDVMSMYAGGKIIVTNGTTWTLAGASFILGNSDLPLTLRSSSGGSQWFLVGTVSGGVYSKAYNVDVQDSNAANGIVIYAFQSTDSTNNANWSFRKLGVGQMGAASTYVDTLGNSLTAQTETIFASAAQSANANYLFDASPYRNGLLICDVTAWVGGASPTIQFITEVLDAASGKWVPVATPAAGAASAVETLVVMFDESIAPVPSGIAGARYVQAQPILGGFTGLNYRVRTVITGSPTSVTFSISFIGKPF